MAEHPQNVFDRVGELLQQFALELAFVDPVEENGVERVSEMIGSIEDAVGEADDVPEQVVMAMIAVRRWIDDRTAADGRLTADTIIRLQEWQPWMVAAVTAWERGQTVATVPAAWSRAERPSIWPSEEVPPPAADAQPATPAPVAAPLPPSPPPTPAAAPVPPPTPALVAEATASPPVDDQEVTVMPEQADAEMLQLFCAEAHDLLRDIEQGVLALEANPTDGATLDSLFRAFHTFKGNVGVIKLTVLQQFTHEMESLLDAARKRSIVLGRDAIGTILAGADLLERFVDELARQLSGSEIGRAHV